MRTPDRLDEADELAAVLWPEDREIPTWVMWGRVKCP